MNERGPEHGKRTRGTRPGRLAVLWAALLWLGLAGPAAAQGGVIRVGGDLNYPPYEFINEQGEPDGYNTELTLAIAEVMGMQVEIELGHWQQVRRRLLDGELDVLQGAVFSPERARWFAFSPPHALINHSLFARKGEAANVSLTDLAGREVIVQRDSIMHEQLSRLAPEALAVPVDTHSDALRLLASGRHDFALVANLPGLYLGRELELSNLAPVGHPFPPHRYGYMVTKGNEALLARFSEGLAILKNTGRQQALYDKWLGPLESPGLPWQKIGQAAALVSLLLLLGLAAIMIWNRTLRREVDRRSREMERQQQQLLQADKMASLGILVSGVAHEINNPSGLLLLNLPVLKEAYQDAEEILEAHYHEHGDFYLGGLPYSRMRDEIPAMLEDMLTSADRIRRIVDDLRDFARQGPGELNETVDLNAVVATAIRLVDTSIRKASQRFEVSYGEGLPPFRGNGQRIEQVVINLIVNACQALTGPEQGIRVSTRYQSGSQELCLEVQDQGRGIAPEHLSRLRDPFFTTKREQGGIGLGLAVSTGIVQEHGGRLEYDSTPGQGTTATLTLPALKGNQSDHQ
ncbi:transporter substrate-binding domain-containing protein [Zobellella iuensis]|uniref:histidine kinase n=1 Tax=Zobellella iuensis TaxID=2803811 RepID=A0ABS1QQ48_9GAMM|nr:transporter substrate-binding domain-containing protein [Zobellella iuensis]MBL1376990.1 transporter substrate-binding domain-containing protein [Zobellella iuensis]